MTAHIPQIRTHSNPPTNAIAKVKSHSGQVKLQRRNWSVTGWVFWIMKMGQQPDSGERGDHSTAEPGRLSLRDTGRGHAATVGRVTTGGTTRGGRMDGHRPNEHSPQAMSFTVRCVASRYCIAKHRGGHSAQTDGGRRGSWGFEIMAAEGSTKAVVTALGANLGIAVGKFVAAAITGSASMLAEGVHRSPTRPTRRCC